ncbi:VOC family protein [Aldersonia sp. NBC_00410]|uniref:VOC family protein n=1 Tax=Aldersonia sp. NBC_00410 TaxID=2975954 RepID=UPI0022537729|nr:VOC family protein [Aldersonia sp. NBC_00410]MCX5043651.1 VOC family protein [Aldersonia sp. NBC_00410]
MLDHTKAFGGFSVDDLATAKTFYGDTLGLPVADHEMGLLALTIADGGRVLIYPKGEHHVPATFTVLNFPVPDVDAAVRELASRGIEFLRYDGFDQDENGISRAPHGPALAWFTDPAGNILSVLEE